MMRLEVVLAMVADDSDKEFLRDLARDARVLRRSLAGCQGVRARSLSPWSARLRRLILLPVHHTISCILRLSSESCLSEFSTSIGIVMHHGYGQTFMFREQATV